MDTVIKQWDIGTVHLHTAGNYTTKKMSEGLSDHIVMDMDIIMREQN